MSVFDQANTKLDECFSEIDRLKKRIDSEGRYLDECIAEIRRLKSRNEKLEKVVEIAESVLRALKRGLDVQFNSSIHKCLDKALNELEP
jgi:chromosome segregation ATPase